MKKNSLWMGAVLVATLALGSVVAFADFGSGGASDLDIDRDRDPVECICTTEYVPVVCTATDGSRQVFSNLCVAGCNGFAASNCRLVSGTLSGTR